MEIQFLLQEKIDTNMGCFQPKRTALFTKTLYTECRPSRETITLIFPLCQCFPRRSGEQTLSE